MTKVVFCIKCRKKVQAEVRAFNTVICKQCGQILSSDISADKVAG